MSEIKKIEHIGTTGGIDGDYSYSFSDNQIVEFIDLLNQVELGMMPVTASDKQTYQEKFAPEIAVRTSMADFKKEDKLVDLPLYAIEQIAEL